MTKAIIYILAVIFLITITSTWAGTIGEKSCSPAGGYVSYSDALNRLQYDSLHLF